MDILLYYCYNIVILSEKHGQKKQPAELRHSNRLKEKPLDHFGENSQLVAKIDNKNVLHSNDVSPLAYTEATLKGTRFREDDIVEAYAKLIRRKL